MSKTGARDQVLFVAAVIVPQLILLASSHFDLTPYKEMASWAAPTLEFAPEYVTNGAWWAAALATTVERVTYALVWTSPDKFKNLCEQKKPLKNFGHPVDVLASFFAIFKILQIGGLFAWYLLVSPEWVDLSTVSALRWLTGAQLIFLGQALNVGIFKAIGKAGVYYGVRLGKRVPWCDGFPFTVMQHPQYIGALMTIFGAIVLLATPAHLQAGMVGLGLYQCVTYAFTMYVEDEL